jgi:hypothetical protein
MATSVVSFKNICPMLERREALAIKKTGGIQRALDGGLAAAWAVNGASELSPRSFLDLEVVHFQCVGNKSRARRWW